MQICTLLHALEKWAPLSYQEPYDNAGLIVGDPTQNCTGVLCSLDCTEAVIEEAIEKGCNLIVSHHPIVFRGIKQFVPNHFVSKTVIKAIQNNIALYAIHTNLDNILDGVNKTLADRLQLQQRKILAPKEGVKDEKGQAIGSGLIGTLPVKMDELSFLKWMKKNLNINVIKHTKFLNKELINIALCGGSGSFLIDQAIVQNVDCFITSDLKYHEFFEADGKLLLVDIGHWESEQWTPSLIVAFLTGKFPTFAVLESSVNTQPVNYLKD